jgi:dihydrofolate reductase
MTGASRVTVHMVASLDGYVAKRDNSVAWLETTSNYEKGAAGEDVAEFLKTIGCYVMGSRTFEHAAELSRSYGWAYGDVPTIVTTRRKLPAVRSSIEFYAGDLTTLVNDRLRTKYENIWVVGGAALVKDCLRLKLVDDIRLTIVPILLGDGTPFFDGVDEQALRLRDVMAYKNGLVELRYEVPAQR